MHTILELEVLSILEAIPAQGIRPNNGLLLASIPAALIPEIKRQPPTGPVMDVCKSTEREEIKARDNALAAVKCLCLMVSM
jgi:hypothetical protein